MSLELAFPFQLKIKSNLVKLKISFRVADWTFNILLCQV